APEGAPSRLRRLSSDEDAQQRPRRGAHRARHPRGDGSPPIQTRPLGYTERMVVSSLEPSSHPDIPLTPSQPSQPRLGQSGYPFQTSEGRKNPTSFLLTRSQDRLLQLPRPDW